MSDTHGSLRPDVLELLEGSDLILHGGDVCGDHILTELAAIAPVLAVSGNMDGAPTPERPLERRIETPLGRVAMTHGHLPGAPSTDRARLVRHFADFAPALVVYGHSHRALLESVDGVVVFNPGSAGPPRFDARPSVGIVELDAAGRPAPRILHFEWKRR